MLKKFNKFMLITMLFSIMLCLMGIILIIYPDISLKVISLIIAVSMIVGGLFLIIDFGGRILFTNFMIIGILLFIMGVILLIQPNIVVTIIPYIVGIYIIINSIFDLQVSLGLKKYEIEGWLLPTLLSILSILCGIFIITYPQSSMTVLTSYFGIVLIIYAVSMLVNSIVFKKNVNDIVKLLED